MRKSDKTGKEYALGQLVFETFLKINDGIRISQKPAPQQTYISSYLDLEDIPPLHLRTTVLAKEKNLELRKCTK